MLIENAKTYSGQEVETIFFRPSFCGKSAEELGVHVIYNMPIPTTIQILSHKGRILDQFASGWTGGTSANKSQKTIPMTKVKAESAYSASDYASMVFEYITNSSDVNLGDLTGTELEKAETELFRKAIVEDVYATMWVGDEVGEFSDYSTFEGFLPTLVRATENGTTLKYKIEQTLPEQSVVEHLRKAWTEADESLRALASEGNLVFYVSSDIYDEYQFHLDDNGSGMSYSESQSGRPQLFYHGIPVVEVPLAKYTLDTLGSFCLLTDRRNLVLALNTASSPENEVRMWYNPDEMENRQRAVFLAGTTILDYNLVSGFIVTSY